MRHNLLDRFDRKIIQGAFEKISQINEELQTDDNPDFERWCPYPQRTPPEGVQVICQYKDGTMQFNTYDKRTKALFDRCVVAWLPKPKPYKPD